MRDKQMQVFEENYIESFTEPQSNGSPLGFEAILERRKKNDELVEEKYRKERCTTERLLKNEY